MGVVIKYLKARPEKLHMEAGRLVVGAYIEAFPCEEGGSNDYSTRAAVKAAKPVDRSGRISATTKAVPVHLTFTGELTVQDEPEGVTDTLRPRRVCDAGQRSRDWVVICLLASRRGVEPPT